MPNTVVTSTTNAVKVVFNDDSTKVSGITKATFAKLAIEEVKLNGNHVEVQTAHDFRWILDYQANNSMLVVDSVDGSSPTSLDDLYNKIATLIE